MKSLLLSVVLAALIVAGWVALRPESADWVPTPSDPAASFKPESREVTAVAAVPPNATTPTVELYGAHLDDLHRAYGKTGESMRAIIAATVGMQRDQVERAKVTFAIHALMNGLQPGDVDYLAACFDRIEDPSFRWWFQWIVRYVPDEKFIGAVGEIWKLDPAGAADRFCDIGTAKSLERLSSLLETDGDIELRRHAIASVANGKHADRIAWLAKWSDDDKRRPEERAAALIAMGQTSSDPLVVDRLMRAALGPPVAVESWGRLDFEHPVKDLRSAAVLGVMIAGDLPALRTLLERADAPGADPALATMVDRHLAGWNGPDVAELVQARVERRGVLTIGDLRQIARDLPNTPRGRLEALRTQARTPDVAAELERLIPAAGR